MKAKNIFVTLNKNCTRLQDFVQLFYIFKQFIDGEIYCGKQNLEKIQLCLQNNQMYRENEFVYFLLKLLGHINYIDNKH